MCEYIWSQKIPPEPRQEEAKEDRARPDLLRSILPFRLGNGSEFQKEEISFALIFVGWALLPVVVTDGQKCPSYSGHGAIDVRVFETTKALSANGASAAVGGLTHFRAPALLNRGGSPQRSSAQ